MIPLMLFQRSEYIAYLVFGSLLVICIVAGYQTDSFENAVTMKAVRFSKVGGPEHLYLNDGEAIPEPGKREVRIHVAATAINRADTLQRKGGYNPPPGASDILGLEASGTIHKLGEDCPDSWKVGDRVMALLAGGGNAEYVVCPIELLMSVPSHFSLTQAAAVPEVWLTAYQLLNFVCHVKKSDTVLIHAGASGVGTAAVQLVKQLGATAIVTAGSQEKIDLAVSLGAKAGVNYKEGDIGDKVLTLTEGRGVDLVLDCVGASMFDDNLKAIAREGRWVLYGLMGGASTNLNLGQILLKRISLTGSTLRSRSLEYKSDLIQAFSQHALPLFDKGTFRPVIDRVMSLSDIQEAHTIMEANKNKGKIVLRVSDQEKQEKEEL